MKILEQTNMTFDNDKVLVCDPCYIFDYKNEELDKAWLNFCALMFADKDNDIDEGTLEFNNVQILFTRTRYGDGMYWACTEDSRAGVPVDAGMICVCKLEDALKINPKFDFNSYAIFENVSGVVFVENCSFKGVIECLTGD